MAKKKQIKKKKFINMEIIRVHLNPDQAVLSCCSQAAGRGAVQFDNQCYNIGECYGGGCEGEGGTSS